MITCPQCQTRHEAGTRFCSQCGSRLPVPPRQPVAGHGVRGRRRPRRLGGSTFRSPGAFAGDRSRGTLGTSFGGAPAKTGWAAAPCAFST